jgi:hypothetical protein
MRTRTVKHFTLSLKGGSGHAIRQAKISCIRSAPALYFPLVRVESQVIESA